MKRYFKLSWKISLYPIIIETEMENLTISYRVMDSASSPIASIIIFIQIQIPISITKHSKLPSQCNTVPATQLMTKMIPNQTCRCQTHLLQIYLPESAAP